MSERPDRPDVSVLRRGARVLAHAVRSEPGIFGIALLGSALYGTMTVASALVLGRVTDNLVVPAFRDGRTTTGALLVAAAAIVGVAVLKAAGIVARRLGAGVMQYRLQAADRRQVTRQYLRLPLSWHHQHPTGQLLSNANADVEATWGVIAPLPFAVGVCFMLVVAAGAMLATDVVLALVAFLVFPAIFGLNVVYQRRLSPLAIRAQELRGDVSATAHESFEAALVVKTLGRERDEVQRFAAQAAALRDANIAVGRVRGIFDPALEALPSLGVVAVLLVGSWRVQRGGLPPGDLVQVAYLFTLLAFPVRAIGWVLGELPRSVVGWDRVRRVLGASGAMPYGTRAARPTAEPAQLTMRDVSYAYDEPAGQAPEPAQGTRDVLHGVTLDIAPGRTVAIVGPTGAGKSTLANLALRLVDPRSGEVLLDGVDVRTLARDTVPAAAAVVPQQTFLFDDTVRGNVTLGQDVDDAQVWAALRLAQADSFVAALPAGLDTRVGERGTSLSGGQRQRIALARAIVRAPRLLLLDDATSSVDPHVEAQILAGLREATAPTTVLVVAYRKATIAMADEVVFLEHGRVVARGTHADLLATSAHYRDLVTAYDRAEQERLAMLADA